jgi:GT2 family glycosyltransferase
MIGIIILNYNSFSDTIILVKDLQLQTVAKDMQIVVVDNASPNNSYVHLKPLEKQYQNVVVLQTGENLGYAKGNNFGLNYLDDNVKPDYVAILNNDIVLPRNCFEKLIEKYKVLDSPAIIAPKQLDINNKELVPYKLNNYLDDCLNLFFVFKIFHKRNSLKYTDTTGLKAMKVEMIPGSFMFAAFETFKNMGFFYPNTFLFVEERFIAVKAKQMNLNNYILLDETYVHAHSKTINTAFSQVGKYKLLYQGWLEFTRTCRFNGKLKAVILKPLMQLSLLEMRLVYSVKNALKRLN